MKKKLHLFLMFSMLVFCGTMQAQLNHTQSFDDDQHGWTTFDEAFIIDDLSFCTGNSAYSGYAYNYLDWFMQDAITNSPTLGASSGMPATLSFQYKLLTDDGNDGVMAQPNDVDWGSITIEYATSPSGPWTIIEVIDPSNHMESDACVLHTSPSFTPPPSTQFYLRYSVITASTEDILQLLFVLDDLSLTQAAAPGCTTTPAVAAVQASSAAVCTTQPVTLSLSPAYTVSGLNFQWQSSTDNVTYTNLAGSANAASIQVLQTASTWYKAIVTCANGGTPVPSTPLQVLTTGLPCYCVPEYGQSVETITRVKIGTLDNPSTDSPTSTVQYEDFTGSIPATPLVIGATYPITLEGNTETTDEEYPYTNHFTVYFDFNRDGDFDDDGEDFYAGSITGSNGVDGMYASIIPNVLPTITIPQTATPGNVVMRIVKLYNFQASDACGEIEEFGYGQTEDYLINLLPAVACSAAPAVTALTADETSICLNSSAQLSMTTNYENSGITYQWQSSPDNAVFTNINGATGITYNAMQTQNTWYRVVVSCNANATFTTPSTSIQILTNPILCYCDPDFEEGVEAISYVSFHTLENPSDPDDEDNAYEDYTSLTAPVVTREEEYQLVVGGNTYFSENYFVAYFDWNHDGEFDETTERIEIGTVEDSDGTDENYADVMVTIPADAALGTTRMRIVKTYYDFGTACEQEDYGQAEDYFITVDAAAGAQAFDKAAFRYYPNPVKDVLNLSYTQAVTNVEVYNIVGQRVISQVADANQVAVDMNKLAAGTYIVKVFSGNTMQTVKVIKQ